MAYADPGLLKAQAQKNLKGKPFPPPPKGQKGTISKKRRKPQPGAAWKKGS